MPKKQGKRKGRMLAGVDTDFPMAAGVGNRIPSLRDLEQRLTGIPQSIKRQLVATRSFTLTCTSAAYAETYEYLNSAYQSGSQAYGYVKYMAFYSKCFVVGARIVVKGVASPIISAQGMAVGCAITTNNTTLGSIQAAISGGLCEWTVMYTNPDRFQLTVGVDVRKFLNKPLVLDDPQLFSSSGADPTQLIVAHIFAQGVGGPGSTSGLIGVMEMQFDCIFTDPIPFT